jgi:hypothetical protein
MRGEHDQSGISISYGSANGARARRGPGIGNREDRVATREGNTWNWRDHEPDPSMVHRKEEAAGHGASAGQQKKTTDDLENIYRQLMKNQEKR